MTTVDTTTTHLRENPFELAREQLRRVATTFEIDPNLISVLGECKKAIEVPIPVSMETTTTRVFKGYRVTHNARGAVEGRHPLPPRRHRRRGQGAGDVDDGSARWGSGGAKGSVVCDPERRCHTSRGG